MMKASGESFKINRHFLFIFPYLLKIMCVYFLPLKNIFKESRKELEMCQYDTDALAQGHPHAQAGI